MQKRKLAIFINTLKRGGAEKTVAFLLNQLKEDFDLHVLMFNAKGIEFDIPKSVHIKQIGKPNGKEATLWDLVKMPFQAIYIKKYLIKNEIPVLLSFLNRPNFVSSIIKMLRWKGNVIISERTMTSAYYSNKTFGGKFGRFLVSKLYKHANLVITNSKFCEQDLRETFKLPNKIITINNPINIEEAQKLMLEPQHLITKKDDEFLFCNIGTYSPVKKQQMLIEAFANLNLPQSRLVIIGKDVPEKLMSAVEKFNIKNQVTLLGLQDNIYPFLKLCDCFVLSSEMEGFPNVILEALACGKPVISTDCKWGPREILAPDTDYEKETKAIEVADYGMLVSQTSKEELTKAMAEMISNNNLREKYKEKSHLGLKEFTIEKIIRHLNDTINKFY